MLVIIGLIVGGILVGGNLIKAAELRKIVSDMEKMDAAMTTFKAKYRAVAGDMGNATQFWGADAACPLTPVNTVPKSATCDGDSNGSINMLETHRTIQQLANAGLIAGQYTGTQIGALTTTRRAGVNAPPAIKDNTVYWVANAEWSVGQPHSNKRYILANRTDIVAGVPDSAAFGFLTPAEAFELDSKIDDGFPLIGRAGQFYLFGVTDLLNCLVPGVPNIYNMAYSGPACMFAIRGSF